MADTPGLQEPLPLSSTTFTMMGTVRTSLALWCSPLMDSHTKKKQNKNKDKQNSFMDSLLRGAVGATLGATPLCQMTQWQRWCSRVSSLRVGLLSEWTSPRSRWWQSQSQPPQPPLARPAMIRRWLTLAAERAPRCPPSLLPWHRRAKRATFMQPSSMEL